METFFKGVIENLVASIIFWVVGGLIFWFYLFFRKKIALRKFFGIKTDNYTIYLSSYQIDKNTVKDRNGITRGHEGKAIPEYEFQTIPNLSSIFLKSTRLLSPDIFKGLIDGIWTRSLPEIRFELSPLKVNEAPTHSLISVGGPKFNAVTNYYLETRNGRFFFNQYKDMELKRWRILIKNGNRQDEIIGKDFLKEDVDIGYIQRIVDPETNATVILIAGLGVNGTRAAANYIASNWLKLYHRYGLNDFGIALKCPDFHKDPEGYRNVTVLTQLPY